MDNEQQAAEATERGRIAALRAESEGHLTAMARDGDRPTFEQYCRRYPDHAMKEDEFHTLADKVDAELIKQAKAEIKPAPTMPRKEFYTLTPAEQMQLVKDGVRLYDIPERKVPYSEQTITAHGKTVSRAVFESMTPRQQMAFSTGRG